VPRHAVVLAPRTLRDTLFAGPISDPARVRVFIAGPNRRCRRRMRRFDGFLPTKD